MRPQGFLRARLARPDPPSPETLIRSVLESGERLLWCGRPRPYRGMAAGVVTVLVFGVACVACLFVTVVGLLDLLAAALSADLWGGRGARLGLAVGRRHAPHARIGRSADLTNDPAC